MRQALQQSIGRQRLGESSPILIPAPVGGLNTRDSIAALPPLDAFVLNNWYPRASEVVQRGGSAPWATGFAKPVKSIIAYRPTNASDKLYGVSDDGIFDITAGGAIGATVQALTDGYVTGIMMTNSAGNSFLWVANGVDTPFFFNGAAWAAPAITGVTNTSIVAPWFFKHRIFFLEVNTMNVYFLPIDAIQGAASPIPLGNLYRLGGNLVAGTSWTQDAGDGPDDLMALITTEGQLAIYAGTDPSSASSWSLIGVWYVGRPMGRRCFFQLGADVGLITENGVFPLSLLLRSGTINFDKALSRKIQPTFTALTAAVGVTTQGFEGCVYPAFDALIINTIPLTGEVQKQFVMNTITGAWCTFDGWNTLCFFVFNGELYFGESAGRVMKAWDAGHQIVADDGADITTLVHTAPNNFRNQYLKSVEMFRLLFAYNGAIDTSWAISPDFADVQLNSFLSRSSFTPGAPWDTSPWDVSSWSPPVVRYKLWKVAAHTPGVMLSLWLQTAQNSGTLAWAGTEFVVVGGGMM